MLITMSARQLVQVLLSPWQHLFSHMGTMLAIRQGRSYQTTVILQFLHCRQQHVKPQVAFAKSVYTECREREQLL